MATTTLTLKLPLLRLNQAKVQEFLRLQELNTDIANQLLTIPKGERTKLTSKDFNHIEIGSAWINQTIRNTNAATKVKQFKVLPLETNNQNWSLHKVGETYSLGFGVLRGIKQRVPLEIHQSKYQEILDGVLNKTVQKGSMKLWRSKKGKWYALLSVSMEVPDADKPQGWIGVDRGQNVLAVASTPSGMPKFWKFAQIRKIRKHYAAKRRRLHKAKKMRVIKRLEQKERRMIKHINHMISKEIVELAVDLKCGIRLEDLSNIRQTTQQKKKQKSDASFNRDYWSYFQLEQFIFFKAQMAGVAVEKVPAAYTTKSCLKCGAINQRDKHNYTCRRCGYRGHADYGASRNIGNWVGLSCPIELQKPLSVMVKGVQSGEVNGTPLSLVSGSNSCMGLVTQEQESPAFNETK
ncbi:transposase [Gloeocapsopsis dulcis]|uniref:Transposase n=1 Tax=Gloeocapsopsis dulcis AAB1 = 1H9 TaxID=1433147 RepID=A0A6N8FSS2_9CHRO|nr:transposase [Gloeocapsopsis dulcis]MUL36143.1 transposase [Gloeocapsopsis dulcis AAB1 = 1H9]WNN91382.1 transposase [Gloeocapsopsis dulcis]